MREILSQAEIDSLLKSLEQGEVETVGVQKEQPKVRKYDFRRPNRFSKNNLRNLSQVHENFARQLANFLTAYLRTPVQVKVATIDQVAFEDFVVSLPGHTVATVFSMNEQGLALFAAGTDLIIPIIDLICGGAGDPVKKSRSLTEIELAIYRRVCLHILERYESVWGDLATVSCSIRSMETNPRLIQAVSGGEMVAVTALTVAINRSQGVLMFCLPFPSMEQILGKKSEAISAIDASTVQLQWLTRQKILSAAALDLTAMLGGNEITVREFLQLSAGDVFTLSTKLDGFVELLVENNRTFLAQPGMIGRQMAVQIVTTLSEGSDGIEQ
ncbi:MAG: Flagellar motor switch protein FliM [Firmicutes bacterium]|nr:Flagellar motor switch protein FliM [Bacillota bacterium]